MRYIDLETYPRRSHYEFFKSYAYPYVGLTANVDVTNLVAFAKARGCSTFLACLWAASQAANSIPEFRQRIADGGIVEYDHCEVGHTVPMPDGTFCNCNTDCRRPLPEFLVYAAQQEEAAKQHHGFVQPGTDENALIFASCVPWVAFTQVIQPTPIPADSNPRIVFGKYIHEGDKIKMPLSIQCNHALVDGRHLGQFYEAFETLSRNCGV